jgi:hypothetical protein
MDTFTLGLGRCWIIRALQRNPLVRFSDRAEAVAVVLFLVAALVVTALAGAVGTAAYEARAQLYAQEAQTRHIVTATAIEDSTVIVEHDVEGRVAEVFRVQARWLVGGIEHVGRVDLAYAALAGDRLDVWVDGSGNQVAAPTPSSRAGIDAVCAGTAVWLIALAGIAGLSVVVHTWLTRRRYRGWEREWAALVSDGSGRTGSQT